MPVDQRSLTCGPQPGSRPRSSYTDPNPLFMIIMVMDEWWLSAELSVTVYTNNDTHVPSEPIKVLHLFGHQTAVRPKRAQRWVTALNKEREAMNTALILEWTNLTFSPPMGCSKPVCHAEQHNNLYPDILKKNPPLLQRQNWTESTENFRYRQNPSFADQKTADQCWLKVWILCQYENGLVLLDWEVIKEHKWRLKTWNVA